jgi:hypothetical protein
VLLIAVSLSLPACAGETSGDRGGRKTEPAQLEPRPWGRIEPIDQGLGLRVFYLTGPAFELERVMITEKEQRVVLTLLERPPDGPTTALGVLACADVTLRRPLAGRQVIDGAATKGPNSRRLPPGAPSDCAKDVTVERFSS